MSDHNYSEKEFCYVSKAVEKMQERQQRDSERAHKDRERYDPPTVSDDG